MAQRYKFFKLLLIGARWACLLFAIGSICSCTHVPTQSAKEEKDGAPYSPKDVAHIPNPTPKMEKKSRYGNPASYVVNGKQYQVMGSSSGYSETGLASWYGTKFHGRLTSNREVYDLYGMTAAHKHLPLPTYVEVENLENKKKIVVRINDRGPFIEDRLIDLSYAAAKKLGVLNKGTARVRITALNPQPKTLAATPKPVYIQLGAFHQKSKAIALVSQLETLLPKQHPLAITSTKTSKSQVYKVQIGPFRSEKEAQKLRQQCLEAKLSVNPMIVSDTSSSAG